MRILKSAVLLLMICLCVTACGNEDTAQSGNTADTETVYQVALLQSLAQGYYDGIITVGELKEHGDTGIGTFEGVNGEMIVLDGVVYQALSDGSINIPGDDETVPFSNVTFFEQDGSADLEDIHDMEALKTELDKIVDANGSNLFYVVKIDGEFSHLKVRSEYKQEKPYKELDEALAEDQVEFDYDDMKGTLVGLYCPDYVGDLNSVGWHLHFISDDLKKGGHVLDAEVKEAKVSYDVTSGFDMYVPDNEEFQDLDLVKDMDEAIENAETRTSE